MPSHSKRRPTAIALAAIIAIIGLTATTLALWNARAALGFDDAATRSIRSGQLALELTPGIQQVEFVPGGLLARVPISGSLTREGTNLAAKLLVTAHDDVRVILELEGDRHCPRDFEPTSDPVACAPVTGNRAIPGQFIFDVPESDNSQQTVLLTFTKQVATTLDPSDHSEDRYVRHQNYLDRLNYGIIYTIDLPISVALQQIRPEPVGWSAYANWELEVEYPRHGTSGQFAIDWSVNVDGEFLTDTSSLITALPVDSQEQLGLSLSPDFTETLLAARHGLALGFQMTANSFNDLIGEGVGLFLDSVSQALSPNPTELAEAEVSAYWVPDLHSCVWAQNGPLEALAISDTANSSSQRLAGLVPHISDQPLVEHGGTAGSLTLCILFNGFSHRETDYSNQAIVRAVSPAGYVVMHSDQWAAIFWEGPIHILNNDGLTTNVIFRWKAGLR